MAVQEGRIGSTAEVRSEGGSWVLADGTRAADTGQALGLLRAGRAAEDFPILVTIVDGDSTYRISLDADGSRTLVDGGQDEKSLRGRWAALPYRWFLVGGAAILLAALLVGLLFIGGRNQPPTPSLKVSEAPAVAGDVLWTIADSANLLGGNSELVATYDNGKLSLRDGMTGTEKNLGPFEVPKPSRVLGPDLIAAQLGDEKVLVVGAYNSRSSVQGVIQGRGERPVIVSKDQRKYLTLKDADSDVTALRPIPSGESVLGGLPQGVVFVSADSVRVGDGKAVKMTPPTNGSKVTAWIAVTSETVVAVWGNTVAIHDLNTGAVLDQVPEGSERTSFDQGVVISNGKAAAGRSFVSLCNGYAVVSGQVWCPSPSGVWTSGSVRLPEKPAAVGSSWWIDSSGNVRRLVKESGQ